MFPSLFGGGGGSIGFNPGTGRATLSGSVNFEVGVGMFAGVGSQVVLGVSSPGPSAPYSQQTYNVAEGNVGWGGSAGYSATWNEAGASVSRGLKLGVGYGAMAGAGMGASVNVTSPQLWCK